MSAKETSTISKPQYQEVEHEKLHDAAERGQAATDE
jgi:hypothetical protein